MLPKDAEKRRKDSALANNQSRLDPHLREKQQKEAVIPYSDERFRDAAIEWLVSTDQVCKYSSLELGTKPLSRESQPIKAFEYQSYQNMINIAACAGSNGVNIPDRRQTRQAIIDMFKQQLVALRDRLNVRDIPHHYHALLTFDT
jgi:hypothetical protein